MSDTTWELMRVDDEEGREPVVHLSARRYYGLVKFHGSLIPLDGRHSRAYFRTRIELSEAPLDGKTAVDDTEATIVGEFECNSLNSESWVRIETDRVDWTGEHTRPRDEVPEWITDEGDQGYVRINLTYDEGLTSDEAGWQSEAMKRKRERFREEGRI